MTTGRDDDRLDRLLDGVARDVPPPRDLWPAIEARLEPRLEPRAGEPAPRRRRERYALAAAVAALAATGVVAWQFASRPPAPAVAAGAGPDAAPVAATSATDDRAGREAASLALDAAFEPHDERYRATRAALEATFRERLALLAPETRARIEQNLEIVRHANADIRAALAADPNSPLLLQLLESTRQQEIDLYTTVARTTEPALPRSTT